MPHPPIFTLGATNAKAGPGQYGKGEGCIRTVALETCMETSFLERFPKHCLYFKNVLSLRLQILQILTQESESQPNKPNTVTAR